ncbi:MAG: sensor histidine kinase [Pseudomonadota bacterium]
MRRALSLRGRLTVIILSPLIIISIAVGLWAVFDAETRAGDRFDRALLSVALAVSRDVALSGGDALSSETNALLADTASGPIFYHVFAPDGVFVTGYATPPVPRDIEPSAGSGPQVFEGIHQSRPVRAVRFTDVMQVDGLSGEFTVTVWQERRFLNDATRDLVEGTLLIILILVATVAFVVWFGVRFGLRPLNELESALARRSSDDLRVIQRQVPMEVTGIVRTLNVLFEQVAQNMAAQADFISNAAHPLRNPIAGVLSLSEAVVSAKTEKEVRRRASDLLDAARDTSELSQKLLLLERAKAVSPGSSRAEFDLSAAVADWVAEFRAELPENVTLEVGIQPGIAFFGDKVMLKEALRNLYQNALRHSGPELSNVRILCNRHNEKIILSVEDDGRGLREEDIPRAFSRFELLGPTSESGLGVSIVDTIAKNHSGELRLLPLEKGLRAEIILPFSPVPAG